MLVDDLIKLLEDLKEKHKAVEDMMGPCEVMFDFYDLNENQMHGFIYKGFTKNAEIQFTADGVYPILTAMP